MATVRHTRSTDCENNTNYSDEPFMKILCMIDWKRGLSVDVFRKTRQALAASFWIDTQRYVTPRGVINPQGIYDMFGEFSLTNGGEVRQGLIDWIYSRKGRVRRIRKNCVTAKKTYHLPSG